MTPHNLLDRRTLSVAPATRVGRAAPWEAASDRKPSDRKPSDRKPSDRKPRRGLGVSWGIRFLVLAIAISVCPGRSAYGQVSDRLPKDVQGLTVQQRVGEQIPLGLTFTDHLGHELPLRSLISGNKPILLTLNYSDCPMLCNVQLNRLVETLQNESLGLQLGTDFEMISISIDPKETYQRVALTREKYLNVMKPGSHQGGWHFLVGSKTAIDKVAEATGFSYRFDPSNGQYYHPAMLVFVTPDGIVSSYHLTFDFEPKPMRLAIVDAGNGKVGSLVDQVVLWCLMYDSSKGAYVASARNIMKLGGLLTVLLVLLTVGPYWFGRRWLPLRRKSEAIGTGEPLPPEALGHG
jgi:protein SCO1